MRVERKGIPISTGIALGKVVLLDRSRMIVERTQIDEGLIQVEKDRFLQSVRRSKDQLLSIKDKLEPLEGGEHLQILNINIMMLEDELFSDEVLRFIETERVNAEWAVNHILSKKSEAFRKVEDLYIKERLADIYYMGERILRNLHGIAEEIPDLGHDSILVAHDISAVDVVAFAKHHAIGIATDTGASTSHSAIVAKSLGIPTVMGLEDITLRACPGDTIYIDGFRGVAVLDPSPGEQEEFRRRKLSHVALEKKLLEYAKLPGRTLDGREIKVNANIEIIEELEHAVCYGAEGIGMYRTEFLFTKSDYFPDEEEQYENYRKVVYGSPFSSRYDKDARHRRGQIPFGHGAFTEVEPGARPPGHKVLPPRRAHFQDADKGDTEGRRGQKGQDTDTDGLRHGRDNRNKVNNLRNRRRARA